MDRNTQAALGAASTIAGIGLTLLEAGGASPVALNAGKKALELVNLGTGILTAIGEKQRQRAEEGRQITDDDVLELMASNDIQEKLRRAKIVEASIEKHASIAGSGDPGAGD